MSNPIPLAADLSRSLLDPIKSSLSAVFQELNAGAESAFGQAKLLGIGRERYAAYLALRVGRFPLFGTTLSADVRDVYVDLKLSDEIESQKYRIDRPSNWTCLNSA